ncbi:MAG: type I methionyl aminopeptidase [Epsilonproteobacteria bacterium]|jgi:methionyl aminopeptidase|uniref:type I methionyl aminopeptidase n=1 Tax=Sulfurospirillum sp. hDNRA2 TaxID=3237298 RepID=UPI0020B7E1A0|nr:type I methionyl aminopeptidase [Sulfurospirillum sp. DNRA8]MCP3652658.1 type I methionyl aminopeptidase [Sulfurospirillum sp. DNRA8]MCR1811509.1 type I methionyl aminopeptidase [Sulfurospirillum sp. DNRA8]NCB54043.1 type I methionyl aminopeptidase [Campylobacterota bacterium]
MAITIKKPQEIAKLSVANQIVARTLEYLSTQIHPGLSLKELNAMGESFIHSHGARPAFKGLYGFPAGVCTSVNEVIIHGIPTDYKLQEGDIIGLDIGTEIDGWYGDSAVTLGVGTISKTDEALIACAKDALYFAIDIIEPEMRFKELSYAIEQFILQKGFVPLRGFCGHGIGRKPHEEPELPNYLEGINPKSGPKIKNGMVFCIEPMICHKDGTPKILADKWSVVSKDGLRGSHYEHTVAIIDGRAEILSKA